MTNHKRWQQRLQNFDKALSELTEAVLLSETRALTKLEEQGLIQAFEYNYDLAWNCIKDFYYSQGEMAIQGSRDAFRLAFSRGLIAEGQVWMEMIQSRIQTSHTYNQQTATQIREKILNTYYHELKQLNKKLNEIKNEQ